MRLVRKLAERRLNSYASFFICAAYILGALAGVFVTARWWGWLLVTLVGLAVLVAAFEANSEWLSKQLEEVEER